MFVGGGQLFYDEFGGMSKNSKVMFKVIWDASLKGENLEEVNCFRYLGVAIVVEESDKG